MKTKNPFTLNLSVYAITVIISFFVMMKPLTANAEKLDFNGDGKSDVFWRNSLTGETSAWLIDGKNVQYTQYGTVPDSSGWEIWGAGDFNGDGNTDVFWYNLNTGKTSAWLIDGENVQYKEYGPTSQGSDWPDWIIADFGDFNGDGTTDVFWFNTYNGQTLAWQFRKGLISRYSLVKYSTALPSSGWYPVSFFVYYYLL